MGQIESFDTVPTAVETVQEEISRQARSFSEISSLSYDEFLQRVSDLNNLAQQLVYPNGDRLMFCVKRGSDCPLIWKSTVKIACVLYDPEKKTVPSYRILNLCQFLKIFQTIQNEIQTIEMSFKEKHKSQASGADDESTSNTDTPSASSNLPDTLIRTVNNAYSSCSQENENLLSECVICLERKPDVMLPCSHCYCQQCIDQWNFSSNTCPVCRQETADKDDCWILSEPPDNEEITAHIRKSLMELIDGSRD